LQKEKEATIPGETMLKYLTMEQPEAIVVSNEGVHN
jgi:hypothetical protein